MAIAAKLGAERKAGMREGAECGCDEKDNGDARSIPTKSNLIKKCLISNLIDD